MSYITLTAEQERVFIRSTGSIDVRDTSGHSVGTMRKSGWTAEELATMKQRLDAGGPRWTTEQVLDYAQRRAEDPNAPKPEPYCVLPPRAAS